MDNQTCRDIFDTSFDWNDTAYNLTNTSDPGNPQIWKELHYEDYVKLFFNLLMMIAGLLGNIAVVATVIMDKSLWGTTNLYVANLAMIDIVMCLICMVPHEISMATADVYILGDVMCKTIPFVHMTCMAASVLTLLTICWDRFVGIVLPHRTRITKLKKKVFFIFIWSVAILVSLPFPLIKKQISVQWKGFSVPQCVEQWPLSYAYFNKDTEKCEYYQPLKKVYYLLASSVLFFLPLIIMILAYIMMYCYMSSSVSDKKRKATRMMFYVLIAFIICWTPFQVLMIHMVLTNKPRTDRHLSSALGELGWIPNYIAYANGFIYPIILGGLHTSYRKGFGTFLSALLECKCPKSCRSSNRRVTRRCRLCCC